MQQMQTVLNQQNKHIENRTHSVKRAWLVASAIVAACVLPTASSFAAEMKIGCVDIQKALEASSAGKKAEKELKHEYDAKKEELEKKQKDLKAMNDDLEKKKSVLSEEVRNRKQAEFQQEMIKYNEMLQQSQVNMDKKQRQLTEPIIEKIRETIDKISKERGYSMILQKSDRFPAVVWSKPEFDITDDVVKMFEKSGGGK